jgi:hypothetical protein
MSKYIELPSNLYSLTLGELLSIKFNPYTEDRVKDAENIKRNAEDILNLLLTPTTTK